MSYDVLMIGIGTVNNSFGIEGVESHCHMFKCTEVGITESRVSVPTLFIQFVVTCPQRPLNSILPQSQCPLRLILIPILGGYLLSVP